MTIQNDITARLKNEYTNQSSRDSFEGKQNKFAVQVFQYPSDLGSPKLKHYIEFQINVRGKSEYLKERKNALFQVRRDSRNTAGLSEDQIANVSDAGIKAVTTSLGGTIGAGVGTAFSKAFGITGGGRISATAVGTALGGVAGYALGTKAVDADLLKPDNTYRISDVIALHMSAPPTVKYQASYGSKELGTLAGIVSGSVFDGQDGFSATVEGATAFGMMTAKLPALFGGTNIQSIASATTRLSLNPFKEVIFESIDFRSFSFKYKFHPKSMDETQRVQEIIKLFKFHAHPEVTSGKLFFIYPSEFQIKYYYGTDENIYLHKFKPTVLESIEISYGGEQYSTFKDGAATEINMELIFRETEILTKKAIDDNY